MKTDLAAHQNRTRKNTFRSGKTDEFTLGQAAVIVGISYESAQTIVHNRLDGLP